MYNLEIVCLLGDERDYRALCEGQNLCQAGPH
jgi:hypothetical protein